MDFFIFDISKSLSSPKPNFFIFVKNYKRKELQNTISEKELNTILFNFKYGMTKVQKLSKFILQKRVQF